MKTKLLSILLSLCVLCTFTIGSAASSDQYYGKKNGIKYYYSMSKEKEKRIDRRGNYLDDGKMVDKWMESLVSLGVGFAKCEVSIPFSLITALVGNSDITVEDESYFTYTYQTKYQTRTIFYYTDAEKKKKKTLITDEKGQAEVFCNFHPVGLGYDKAVYSEKLSKKKNVKTKYYSDKDRNLDRCDILKKHNSKEYWYLKSELVSERWKEK